MGTVGGVFPSVGVCGSVWVALPSYPGAVDQTCQNKYKIAYQIMSLLTTPIERIHYRARFVAIFRHGAFFNPSIGYSVNVITMEHSAQ